MTVIRLTALDCMTGRSECLVLKEGRLLVLVVFLLLFFFFNIIYFYCRCNRYIIAIKEQPKSVSVQYSKWLLSNVFSELQQRGISDSS